MVVADICVEIGPAGVDHDLAQQPRADELVQRVVDRGERHRHRRGERLVMELFGRDMAVALVEQQARQRQPLTRRPQMGRSQHVDGGGIRTSRVHGANIGRRRDIESGVVIRPSAAAPPVRAPTG